MKQAVGWREHCYFRFQLLFQSPVPMLLPLLGPGPGCSSEGWMEAGCGLCLPSPFSSPQLSLEPPPTQSPIKTRGYSSQVGVAGVYQRSVLMSGSIFSPLNLWVIFCASTNVARLYDRDNNKERTGTCLLLSTWGCVTVGVVWVGLLFRWVFPPLYTPLCSAPHPH